MDCDIYLLDDVFSAVDAHTSLEIFKGQLLEDELSVSISSSIKFVQLMYAMVALQLDHYWVESSSWDGFVTREITNHQRTHLEVRCAAAHVAGWSSSAKRRGGD
ncbi:abc transporter c family member 4 [Quercus suber]|uniref:Abc transporter c family member 4 n=1 Tax=Quercus suber TaxID=58331 RepID=A0AAW0LNQ4_QUESU